MVGIQMAHLNYLSLDIFLIYFDHSNRIPCVSMESCCKNHVETGKFPYGLCIIQVRYGWYTNGSPKIFFCRYFVKIFWPFQLDPCVSMDPYSKNHVETAKFPYGLCIIQVSYGRCTNGSPKISFFRYFLKIFWPFQ
jgi:hypothetical protein